MCKPRILTLLRGVGVVAILASSLEVTAQELPAAPAQSIMQAFKKSVDDRLDADRVKIRQVAEPVLERIRKLNAYGGDAANQRIKTQTAEVEYENAKLMREVCADRRQRI